MRQMEYQPRTVVKESGDGPDVYVGGKWIDKTFAALGKVIVRLKAVIKNNDADNAHDQSRSSLLDGLVWSADLSKPEFPVHASFDCDALQGIATLWHWMTAAELAALKNNVSCAKNASTTITVDINIPFADLRCEWEAPDGEIYSPHLAYFTLEGTPKMDSLSLEIESWTAEVIAYERHVEAPFVGAPRALRVIVPRGNMLEISQPVVQDLIVGGDDLAIFAAHRIQIRRGGMLLVNNATATDRSAALQVLDLPDFRLDTSTLLLASRGRNGRLLSQPVGRMLIEDLDGTFPDDLVFVASYVVAPGAAIESGILEEPGYQSGAYVPGVPGPAGFLPPSQVGGRNAAAARYLPVYLLKAATPQKQNTIQARNVGASVLRRG